MYAKRMNKIYTVSTPREKQAYLERGFDLYDEDDELIASSPRKTVAYAAFESLCSENEQLKAKLAGEHTAPRTKAGAAWGEPAQTGTPAAPATPAAPGPAAPDPTAVPIPAAASKPGKKK